MTYREEGSGDNNAIFITSIIDNLLQANHAKEQRVASKEEKHVIVERIKDLGIPDEDIVCQFYDSLPNIVAARQGTLASRGRKFLEDHCKGDFEFFRASVIDAGHHRIKVNGVEHVCLNYLTKQDFDDIISNEQEELENKKFKTAQTCKLVSLIAKDMAAGQLFFQLAVDGVYMFGDPTAE